MVLGSQRSIRGGTPASNRDQSKGFRIIPRRFNFLPFNDTSVVIIVMRRKRSLWETLYLLKGIVYGKNGNTHFLLVPVVANFVSFSLI